MSFTVAAEAYDRFMGQFSRPLAERFVDAVDVRPGLRALDVGCGPGALTAALVTRLGEGSVSAVDPSRSFVAAARQRFPGVDVRAGAAERLEFRDQSFDRVLAQLVVHFMTDPVAGLAEMGRVTRAGGVVAACVWDHAGSAGPLSLFWRAVHDLDPTTPGESQLAGTREGHLAELCEQAGLRSPKSSVLTVTVPFASHQLWWEPYLLGVGPAGGYVAGLEEAHREALRQRCFELLPPAPFEVAASAWCVTARPEPALR